MDFFRRKPAVPAAPGRPAEAPDAEALKSLTTRKDQELRNLGEIYYASSQKGRPDARALARKLKEIQRIDERIAEISQASKPAPRARNEPRLVRPRPCSCGAQVAPHDRFCPSCGATVATAPGATRPCPACNRLVDAGAQFCSQCGASMSQSGTLKVRHPFTGQEASFDFVPAFSEIPTNSRGTLDPDAQDEPIEPPPPEEPAEPDGRGWVRDLERFARPAQVDSQAFLSRGREFLQVGRFREAAAEFEAAVLQNARDARAQYLLGVSRYKNGEVDAAMDAFERAARLDRNNPDAHNDLGLCYVKKGQWREAIKEYQEALRIAPSHSDAHYNLAQLFVQQMSYPDAIRHLQLYLQYSPRARDFKQVTNVIDRLQLAVATGQRMGPETFLPQH